MNVGDVSNQLCLKLRGLMLDTYLDEKDLQSQTLVIKEGNRTRKQKNGGLRRVTGKEVEKNIRRGTCGVKKTEFKKNQKINENQLRNNISLSPT